MALIPPIQDSTVNLLGLALKNIVPAILSQLNNPAVRDMLVQFLMDKLAEWKTAQVGAHRFAAHAPVAPPAIPPEEWTPEKLVEHYQQHAPGA